MKKIIIALITLLAIVGICFFVLEKTKSKEKETLIEYISIKELQNKIDNKDDFILVITQTGCSHCESYKPVLENVSKKYNITFYDVNLTNLNENDYATLSSIANSSGTPTTIFFENGEEKTTLNRIVGESSETKLVLKLKKLGYIKGDN